MKRISIAFLGAVVLAGAVRAAPESDEVYEQVHRAIVRIEASTGAPNGGYFGTGSIVSPDGLVLTSTTVVPPGATRIEVIFHDGSRNRATPVLTHQAAELALVRIVRNPGKRDPLPCLVWGDSDLVRVGDIAYTAGDFWNSIPSSAHVGISRGVVSGRYELTARAPIVDQPVFLGEVIETSASMNPGTDGGPLLDGEGRLVGLMSLNISPVRFQGVAVPANALRAQIRKMTDALPAPEHAALARISRAGDSVCASGGADPMGFLARARAASLVRLKVPRGPPPPKPPRPLTPPMAPGLAETPPVPKKLQDLLEAHPDLPVTAVIWDDAGYLLTTCYNLDRANGPVEAETAPGVWETCSVVGWCRDLDLALLKAGRDIGDPIPRSEAKDLFIGDPVAVVAANPHPGGERHTVETGIVSATSRIFNTRYQLDVRTAHADSGGAVIDGEGRFAGLLSHVKPEAMQGVISGVSFLTPLHKIEEVMPRLMAGEKIDATPRPFLGFGPSMEPVERGIRVGMIIPGAAAEKGGLKANDVILAFDGVPVTSFMEIFDIIQSCQVGQKVKLKILRSGLESELEMTLGKRPDTEQ